MLKRYALWIVTIALIGWLIQSPGSAAQLTRELGGAFGHLLGEMSRFVSGL